MDPAGPAFYAQSKISNWKLGKNDAKFVDCIHTSAAFGILESIGHSKILPNLGLEQPGCNSDPICSHGRSYEYFTESILSRDKFQASSACNSPLLWKTGLCKCTSNCNHMGFYTDLTPGSFYLKTNSQSPYSLNNSHVLPKTFLYLFFLYILLILNEFIY